MVRLGENLPHSASVSLRDRRGPSPLDRHLPIHLRDVALPAVVASESHDAACELAGWQDERQPFRIINACFILHWILVAISLLLQFLLPLKGVTVDVGHEQLWYRARLRATAASRLEVSGQVPMHLTLAYLKPKLRGTPFERSHLEPVLNGLNAAMVCIIVWSLDRQWRTSGVRDALDALESDAASEEAQPSEEER
ncbi:unnamed protein product [Durusdinium trenchii]|uniref:Uncharacterized protein n=1 Tax=Durusdinium trenchii TaxID=1381693 RepID=A0ABP0SZ03_9DINO